jgi:hypothetical protein
LLPLNIAELQVAGFAQVTAIEPCPLIASGDGSVITGRFVTRQVDTIARVEILGAEVGELCKRDQVGRWQKNTSKVWHTC